MTHQGMQEEQAWQTLRKMAMDKNQRMVEIARALLMVEGDLAANTKGVDAQSMAFFACRRCTLGENRPALGKSPSALLPKLASRLHYLLSE